MAHQPGINNNRPWSTRIRGKNRDKDFEQKRIVPFFQNLYLPPEESLAIEDQCANLSGAYLLRGGESNRRSLVATLEPI